MAIVKQRTAKSSTLKIPEALKSYLMMKISLQQFGKIVSELTMAESQKLVSIMNQTLRLYSAILVTDEAKQTHILPEKITEAIAQLQTRFNHDKDFKTVLKANNLNKKRLSEALELEMQCEEVLEHVSDCCAEISDDEAERYYQAHIDKFKQPERRKSHHILITINPDFAENTAENSRKRLEVVRETIDPANFAEYALRHSECPTAMNNGELGLVEKGQLHPELDDALFVMDENSISAIVESEIGLHLLWCEKIIAGHTVAFEQARDKIVEQHLVIAKKHKQKAWIAGLFH